jgi:glycosyltransferase involved in cell wall biosynthesis
MLPEASDPPLVAVVIPALDEAGKIGRVLDKMPADPRLEAIVVHDSSTDRTRDEARAQGAALMVRHDLRQGVGAAIRDGLRAAMERERPYVALLSGDGHHEPAELVPVLEALLANADYVQGSRWRPGGRRMLPLVPQVTMDRGLLLTAQWLRGGGRGIAAQGPEPPKLTPGGESGGR